MADTNEMLSYRLTEVEKKLEKTTTELAKLRAEELQREVRQFRWGIGALGSVIMALASVVWAYRSVIFK